MKRASLVFLAGCLLLVMFFHQGMQANPAARLLTVYGLVETRHLYADKWADTTIDKAIIKGHTYSDKAPLTSFMVLPFYWMHRAREHAPMKDADKEFAVHVGDVLCAALPFGLFAVGLYRRVRRVMSPLWASSAALAALFGTSVYNYSNVYYSHVLAGALFIGAYALSAKSASPRYWAMLLAGFAAGLAVLSEYPLIIPVAILFVSLAFQQRFVSRAFVFGLGALGPAVALLAWNRLVTGSALDFPYSHVSDQFKEMHHLFGVRLPDLEAAWELLFGQYRGMFFYGMPLLVLAILAFQRRPRKGDRRWLLGILCAAQYLFVSSYFKWDGGWCVGPRHLATVMMLLIWEGLPVLALASRAVQAWFYALAMGGIVINVCAAATDPIPQESFTRPYFQVFWAHVLKSDFNSHALLIEAGMKRGRYMLGVWMGLLVTVALLSALADRFWARRRKRYGAAQTT